MKANVLQLVQPVFISLAVVVIILAAPLLRLEHRFTHYGSTTGKLDISCGVVWASSSTAITVPIGLDACDDLITKINTDDDAGAMYLAVDASSATFMRWSSILALALAVTVLVTSTIEIAAAFNSNVWLSVRHGNVVAAVLAWVMIVLSTHARAAASAAPDPGAYTRVWLTTYARVLAALPLLNLSRDVLRHLAKKNA